MLGPGRRRLVPRLGVPTHSCGGMVVGFLTREVCETEGGSCRGRLLSQAVGCISRDCGLLSRGPTNSCLPCRRLVSGKSVTCW